MVKTINSSDCEDPDNFREMRVIKSEIGYLILCFEYNHLVDIPNIDKFPVAFIVERKNDKYNCSYFTLEDASNLLIETMDGKQSRPSLNKTTCVNKTTVRLKNES